MKGRTWRGLWAALIVAAGSCLVALLFAFTLTDREAAKRDFIGYWAAGKQIVRGGSPYDSKTILQLEEEVGLENDQIKLTPSPPAALSIVVPLGFMKAKTGLIVWMMLQLAGFSASIWIIWILEGRPASRLHLLGYLFAPALACIMAGQLGIFCLVGVELFLLCHESKPFFAGAALLPCALKPHLFLPVALVLVLWSLRRKHPQLIAGFVLALLVSNALVLHFDGQIWSQYSEMMKAQGLRDRFAPTFAAELRLHAAPRTVWLQYLPMLFTCCWAAWYYWTRWNRWKWLDHGMWVLLISILCAPYAWLTDEAVLLPTLLAGVYRATASRRSLIPIAVLGAAALIELFADVRITSWYYMWTVPAWLGWFAYATWDTAVSGKKSDEIAPALLR